MVNFGELEGEASALDIQEQGADRRRPPPLSSSRGRGVAHETAG